MSTGSSASAPAAETRPDTSLRALLQVVFEKELVILKRYWFNTASGLGANYIMFVLLFFGGQASVPTVVDDNLTGIIVGFFVWTMAWGTFQSSAQTLTMEAAWGTLEQMYMSPLGLFSVISVRILVKVTYSIVTGGLMLVLMMLTTRHWIRIDPVTIVPLAFVTMTSATGLGYAFGGLALVYKRISNVFIIVQFLLVGAIGAPPSMAANLLPLAWGTDLLVLATEDGASLWELPVADLVGVSAVSAGYVLLGYVAFQYSIRVAKRRGVMGDY